jgi:hypothetical protein
MLMSRHQTTGQNHNIKVANKSSENAAQSRYLGTAVTNQNYIHEEIESRLYSWNSCYLAVQNFTYCFVWLLKTVSHVKGRAQVRGV